MTSNWTMPCLFPGYKVLIKLSFDWARRYTVVTVHVFA